MMTSLSTLPQWRRRRAIAGLAALAMCAGRPATGATPAPAESTPPRGMHFPFGPVTPARPVQAWKVTVQDGRTTDLATVLRGQVTAVQLMFTGCSAVCPLQGALFAQAQREIRQHGLSARLLSISVDPLGDTPQALTQWLRQFGAMPGWLAVSPQINDVERISSLLGGGGEGAQASADVHSGQVFVVDRRGDLVYRTATMPPVSQLMLALAQLSRG